MFFPLSPFLRESPFLAGATLGTKHATALQELLGRCPAAVDDSGPGEIVLIDFSGVDSVSGSYLKALLFQFVRHPGNASLAKHLNAFPIVVGLGAFVVEELVDVVGTIERSSTDLKRLAVEALARRGERVLQARLYGQLDPALDETLRDLEKRGSATAGDLHAHASGNVTITAFNNRLSDLNKLRLARKRREGRQWIYEPIAKEIVPWASSS